MPGSCSSKAGCEGHWNVTPDVPLRGAEKIAAASTGMQNMNKALVMTVAVAAILVSVLSLAYAQDGHIGTTSSPLGAATATQPAPQGCPDEAANGLKRGWLIKFENRCPTQTLRVAVQYQAKGQRRSIGYWPVPPGGLVPVALTDNIYFVYYAVSTTNDWRWPGDYCFNPCGTGRVCGRQVHIDAQWPQGVAQYMTSYKLTLTC